MFSLIPFSLILRFILVFVLKFVFFFFYSLVALEFHVFSFVAMLVETNNSDICVGEIELNTEFGITQLCFVLFSLVELVFFLLSFLIIVATMRLWILNVVVNVRLFESNVFRWESCLGVIYNISQCVYTTFL